MPTYAFTHGNVAPRQTLTGHVPSEHTHQDATNLRVRSVAAHQITRVAPVLRPGTVYAVKYQDMFTWTRQSRTPAAYGPTADCTDAANLQDWHYTCQAARPKTQKMNSGTNYLFVVGPINTVPSCMLLFFFNSCATLDAPYRACAPTNADGAVAQGIYLPAIYDRETGTLFSETFEAPLNAADNINELKWHIYGKAQSIGTGDCCTRLTMTRAKVTARLCQPEQAAALQSHLLHGIMHRFRQKDDRFLKWVAGHHSVTVDDPYLMRGLFTDESRATPDSTKDPVPICATAGYVSNTYAPCVANMSCPGTCSDPEATTSSLDCDVFFPHGSVSL